ncbi:MULTISPECIES: urease accessory protein UreF [Hydrogenophilaceae]|jgi:urease accessory protein|uniref:Urease accessory protein UreF n=1 Tax=Hydrogenophilus thermoluteolus TaxID=297 RepID=A0A2Z6E0T1_HYDTE|nr:MULTISPECIES: urease accessory protein UreF [Hydrogenophilaceae]BBD78391.1 urease accessory protein UreF [Hydrogenophilus thermoluteolus]GLW61635.1 urease accessory protein UreF [Hydrogenophilus thermoluteolus]
MTAFVLSRLLQLASPALPVGAYSYSQGLELAAECGVVRDEATAGEWIGGVLRASVGSFEAPLLVRVMAAAEADDWGLLSALNERFVASRESSELRNETLQMGHSLHLLLEALQDVPAKKRAGLREIDELSFPVVWGCIAAAWCIPPCQALTAYLWAWAENQVMAAVKIVPLGQSAGQRLLLHLGAAVEQIAAEAVNLDEAEWSNFAPGLAIASCQHETQYTRLFRS